MKTREIISKVKRTGLVIAFLFATGINSGIVKAQLVSPVLFAETRYGFSVTEMTMNNGHNKAYAPKFTVENGRKILEMGVIMQDYDQIFTGFSATYKIMLGKNSEMGFYNSKEKVANPYFFYNFNYFSVNYSLTENPNLTELVSDYGSKIRLASHEHYVGFGMKLNITDKSYVDAGYGVGTYIGSTGNPKSAIDKSFLDKRTGLTRMLKISVGLNLF
jgi:hypothetical protein